jgi:hypothetical protein
VPAPEVFRNARSVGVVARTFERVANDGSYWLVSNGDDRLSAVLIAGANAAMPAAVVIPLDADFAARADAALRLWRVVIGRPHSHPPQPLTRQRRHRLRLTVRALDGRLAGESYRVIAQGLFGRARVPTGAGWKTHELRDRTIRLARAGLTLMRGGYLDLLRRPRPQRE